MSSQAPRSLLTPCAEPLPPYTPRQASSSIADPETSSILSSAPSYHSAAPSYHSTVPSRETSFGAGSVSGQSSGIVASSTARPGLDSQRFTSQRLDGPRSNHTRHASISNPNTLYNISEWVPATGGIQARHYQNVARRRATEASMGLNLRRSVSPLLDASILETGPGIGALSSRHPLDASDNTNCYAPPVGSGHWTDAYPRSDLTVFPPGGAIYEESTGRHRQDGPPLSPYEDPDLVGEAAAARFRSQRLYRTFQQQENQQLRSEFTSHQLGRPGRFAPLIPPARQETGSASPSLSSSAGTSSQSITPVSGASHPGSRDETIQPALHRPATTSAMDEALQQESQSWDFMLSQMTDWQERQQSWSKFKEEMDNRMTGGMLNRVRLGISVRRSTTSESGANVSGYTSGNTSDGASGSGRKPKEKKNKDECDESKSSRWKRKFSFSMSGN